MEKAKHPPSAIMTFVAEDIQLDDWPLPNRVDILDGNPQQKGIVLYREPSRRVSYGIWEVTPGKLRVEFGPMTEQTQCLWGRVTMTDLTTGAETQVGPGTRVIVAVGTIMTLEIHETYRCVYSAYEEEWDDNRHY
jgi:uncharacterized cupin superfamily protein